MVFDLKKLIRQPKQAIDPELLEKYAAHYAELVQTKFNFERSEENASGFDAVIRCIAHWRAFREGLCSAPERGLFIFGDPGTGKTTALQLFSALCDVDFISTDELSKAFSLKSGAGFWSISDEFIHRALIVDDLGCEETSRSFGNVLPMADFIRERERQWQLSGIPTFFTSNARNREELSNRYGRNICSRLLGMCDFVHFSGKDYRLKR